MGRCTLVDPLQCSRAAGHTLSHSALPSPLLSACTLCTALRQGGCTFGGMIVMVWSPTRPRDKRDRRRPPALWGVPSHIAHSTCWTLHTLHTSVHCTCCFSNNAQGTNDTSHSAQGTHQSMRCTHHRAPEPPTHKAHKAYGAEHTHCCTLNTTNSTILLWKQKDRLHTAALGCLVGTSVCTTLQ